MQRVSRESRIFAFECRWLACLAGLMVAMVVPEVNAETDTIVAGAPTAQTSTAQTPTAKTPAAKAVATLRLDLYHTGNVDTEIFSVDRLVVEPLPWAGNPDQPIDTTELGKYRFSVRRLDDDQLLYSRGYASIYGEWETTGEAKKVFRTFHESLRFPHPGGQAIVVVEKRDGANRFEEIWRQQIDPEDMFVDPSAVPEVQVTAIQHRGDSAHKVDLLLLGDGYSAQEHAVFLDQARRLTEALFSYAPFSERRDDFNVWAMAPTSPTSGVSRPSTDVHYRTPSGVTYDAFGSERYVLTFENRAWRDLASWAPYDVVEILVNAETYGGGGIFGLYSTVAAGNDWAEYLFIHEFGHHFAALADEYYTSSVAYEIPSEQVEPWEVNATLLSDPEDLKWADVATPDVEVPTPWPKERFEKHSYQIQARRREIRQKELPETVMNALFREQQAFEVELFGKHPHAQVVGAFEGSNYAPKGMFRPQMDCVMFSRNPVPFCAVCQRGISTMIDLYTMSRAVADEAVEER